MVFELFRWWYGAGWRQASKSVVTWTNGVNHAFSVPILLRTLFAPWRKITSVGGKSLEARFQASVDNLISRAVGFTVRLLVLITAGLMYLGSAILGVAVTIVWPLVPIAILLCLFKGLIG